jgi:pilus assembly protein Flp/PilA
LVWTIDEAGSDSGCTLPNATLTCSFGVLSPGQSHHVHIRAVVVGRAATVSRNDNCGQRVTNVATVQFGGVSIQSNLATEDVNCVPPTTVVVVPVLPSTSTSPDNERDYTSLGLLLFAVALAQIAVLWKGEQLMSTLEKFTRREDGQGLVEYALIIAIIAIAVIVAMIFLRDQIIQIFSNIGNNLT